MATAFSKTSCVTCGKGAGQFKCEGCSQIFCTKHVAEHRQTLNQQLDEVIVEHDTFQQTILEDQNQYQPLVIYINQWEQKSIDEIRQSAKEMRDKVSQLADMYQKRVTQGLQHLKEQIKKAREEDDFFEMDLQNWISIIEKFKQELKTASLSNNVKEDKSTPLVYQIQIFSSSSKERFIEVDGPQQRESDMVVSSGIVESRHGNLKMKSRSNPVNKMHPFLQYTNQDGIYVNPKSLGVTAIWYFYSPTRNRWFWTPYENYNVWMPVDELTVKSGYYKDQQPALINIDIIKYMRENNPIPPSAIIGTALKAENRVLKI